MNLREKLANRGQQFLPPNTQIRQAFMVQTGPNPLFFLLTWLIFFAIQYRIVVVADDAIYVLRSSKFRAMPKELVGREPRTTQFGPQSGVWGKIQLLGERHWVHRRFYKDMAAADAALSAGSPTH